MKVYVVTREEEFDQEMYVTVKASKEEAERVIKAECPNAMLEEFDPNTSQTIYDCYGIIQPYFMYIHEEEV